MSTPPSSHQSATLTSPIEANAAEFAAVSDLLRGAPSRRGRRRTFSLVGPGGETIPLPEAVIDVVEQAALALSKGSSVQVVCVNRELTTQQAADLLNVSRQYLVRLLDEGRIPSRRTGTHRRIRVADVTAFKAGRDRTRDEALAELARMSEDAGGYEELE